MTPAPRAAPGTLLPCPFCGGGNATICEPTCTKSTPYDKADRAFPIVRCFSCFAEAAGNDWDQSGDTAVLAWNRRASPPTDDHGWQPIETAPRDGSAILVCYAPQYDTNGFLPVAVRWRSFHPNAKGKEMFRDSSGSKIEAITHWLPLPAAPFAEGR